MTSGRRVDIVGAGLGPKTLTREAADSIAQADLLVGSPRLLAEHACGRAAVAASLPAEAVAAVRRGGAAHTAVLMSGDVGFHSGAAKVWAALRDDGGYDVRLLPGVAAPVLFAARLGVPWENSSLVSCHGLDGGLVSRVRRCRRVFALTGRNVPALAAQLIDAGYGGLAVHFGQNLGLPSESIGETTVERLPERAWPSLTVLLIENPKADARVRSGLPDDRFLRGQKPMTKAAVRALVLSRLAPRPTDVCYDIGCGTGSVTVELALAAYDGQVWAVDKDPEAIALTKANCRNFHIGNATVVQGLAPAALAAWPPPDTVFIGGTAGGLEAVVAAVLGRNPAAQIAITAIAVESAARALAALADRGLEPQITQLTAADGRSVGGLHLLFGHNPVAVVSGGGRG
ncbi:MAG: precorrin-6Y C5,15-methyltransferase (decarboxylating) subunit CbiT [Propionibacteriaceae bacterium]|jgi:precorrin-6Y C5,15-methyltransferase (decarboxylating)|nr:precorrin-6Y C5,15-methyltransferase (decarboxylating) subunit CbiT [Propionibacteriaceae bacterium]